MCHFIHTFAFFLLLSYFYPIFLIFEVFLFSYFFTGSCSGQPVSKHRNGFGVHDRLHIYSLCAHVIFISNRNATLYLEPFSVDPGNTLLTRRVLPPGTILSNLTGHALWQTFVNETSDLDGKAAKRRDSKPASLESHRQVRRNVYLASTQSSHSSFGFSHQCILSEIVMPEWA